MTFIKSPWNGFPYIGSMSNKACSKSCSSASSCNKDLHKGGVIWILANASDGIHFFLQRSGMEIMPFSIGCCCARHAGNPGNMAQYMEAALHCGQYDGVVLMGNEDKLESLKMILSPTVQSRVIAEIARDLGGLPEDSLTKVIRECALF